MFHDSYCHWKTYLTKAGVLQGQSIFPLSGAPITTSVLDIYINQIYITYEVLVAIACGF